jgi:hypothetical protein
VAINVLARDFDTIKQELIAILQQTNPSLAASLSESDVLQIFLNFFALIGDIMSYQVDASINEVFVDTAAQFESLARLGKLVGVVPKLPTATVVVAVGSVPVAVPSDIRVNQGITVPIAGVPFEVSQTFMIPAGLTVNTGLVLVQGTTTRETFIAQGLPNEVFTLSGKPVAEGSLSVTTAFGLAQQVDTLAVVDGPENAFEIEVDRDFGVSIRFGDNVNGAILPQGSEIVVEYRNLGGMPVIVPPNALDTTVQGVMENGTPVDVTVTNLTAGITGSLGDSTVTLRQRIKAAAQKTAVKVTASDLNNAIISLGGITAVNTVKDIGQVDLIHVYLWKRDSVTGRLGIVPQTIIDSVDRYLEAVRPLNIRFSIEPGKIKAIGMKIQAKTTAFNVTTIANLIRQAVFTFFFNSVVPGGTINPEHLKNFIFQQVPELTEVKILDSASATFPTVVLAEDELADLAALQVDVTVV